jgi:hypothetical protein
MDNTAATLTFYIIALIYPVFTGPIAGWILVLLVRKEDRNLILLYWPILILMHVFGYVWLLNTLGDLSIGPGFISCLITPIFGVSTALGLRIATRRLSPRMEGKPAFSRWLIIGTIFLPLLQGMTLVVLILLAPSR